MASFFLQYKKKFFTALSRMFLVLLEFIRRKGRRRGSLFRGNEAAQQGRYEEAMEYYDRVLAIEPDATRISGQVNY